MPAAGTAAAEAGSGGAATLPAAAETGAAAAGSGGTAAGAAAAPVPLVS